MRKGLSTLDHFKNAGKESLLKEGLHGIEKEALRLSQDGEVSQEQHPSVLGSSLTNPFFTTDFAEAQVEFVTPPFKKVEKAFEFLSNLHAYLYQHLKEEYLCPSSSPPSIKNKDLIHIAHFGYSKIGYDKWLYRRGLELRYGKKMQLLSGIHHSFSFSDQFWHFYSNMKKSKLNMKAFISDQYFALCRNFLRNGWLCSYLFGATPMLDSSYFDGEIPKELKQMDESTCLGEYATSLRMSHLGYFSKIQMQLAISFNSLEEHIKDLKYALTTPHAAFTSLGLYADEQRAQVNLNLLQIEAEHYSRIRPKPDSEINLRPIKSLKSGVHYFETRILDLDPFSTTGLSLETLRFLHMFYILCLFENSPSISKEERKEIFANQDKVALYGRKPELKLRKHFKDIPLNEWALEILNAMKSIAELLGPRYTQCLENQMQKIKDPDLLPSSKLVKDVQMSKKSLTSYNFQIAKKHKQAFLKENLSLSVNKVFEKEAKKSMDLQKVLEEQEDDVLAGYEDMEVSTQIVIREALKRKIKVIIRDRKSNIIELIQNNKKEILKQATITNRDSYLAYHLMKNKEVCKQLLRQNGFNVPTGKSYSELIIALNDYEKYRDQKIVVKPTHANYGLGISFVEKGDKKSFKKGIQKALQYDKEFMVESFVLGEEYRFLVIGKKVVAVCKRLPASVIGDGKKNIKELVDQKNIEIKGRPGVKVLITFGDQEKKYLKDHGFNLTTIPKKNQRVYLLQNSNVSTGGESIDFTDEMPKYFKDIAKEAAALLEVSFCGLDILIKDIHSKEYSIIEMNYNPALTIHRYPNVGKKRYVEKEVLNFLGFKA